MRRITLLLWVAMSSVVMSLSAQRSTVAFYNVENMFDTIPSLFYDDSDYTPRGRYRWNTTRYIKKLTGLSRVLDEVRADVVGLAEIENEQVVRDLVLRLTTDYCYVCINGGDSNGRDLAFLYKGDRFEVERAWLTECGFSREFLNVRGWLLGVPIHFVVCHLPSVFREKEVRESVLKSLQQHVASIAAENPELKIVVMGDMNWVYDKEKQSLLNYEAPLLTLSEKGYGSYNIKGRWSLIDNIFICGGSGFSVADCGIYIRRYMVRQTNYGTYPYRTFSRYQYKGGISDHLPVYVILEREVAQ